MIKANELRIGSWVQFKDPCVVRGIPDTLYGTVNMLYGNVISVHCESNGTFYDSSAIKVDLQPIILTEELLLKCGFRKLKLEGYDVHFKYTHPKLHSSITAIYNADFSMKLDDVARGIKSLHQLQNLCFALTGQELEITL